MNINEKFLLKLIESTDLVYCFESEPDYLYFFPKDSNIEIQIPHISPTTNVNIKFMSRTNNDIINFLIDSPDEIKEFMKLLYQKYENYLNEKLPTLPKKALDIFDNMLTLPIDSNYPYHFDGTQNSPYIEEKNKTSGCSIFLYEALSPEGHIKQFNPLEPIAIPCYYSNGDEDSEDMKHYKVIPAYMAKKYPVLSNLVKLSNVVKNTSELSDMLYSLGGNMAPKLNTMILEGDLDSNKPKKSKPKL
jgi:hypothetical protein